MGADRRMLLLLLKGGVVLGLDLGADLLALRVEFGATGDHLRLVDEVLGPLLVNLFLRLEHVGLLVVDELLEGAALWALRFPQETLLPRTLALADQFGLEGGVFV